MPDEGPDYASPSTQPAPAPRTLGQWVILLATWAVGLVVWTIYAAVIVVLLSALL
jgi:hypothetical protein